MRSAIPGVSCTFIDSEYRIRGKTLNLAHVCVCAGSPPFRGQTGPNSPAVSAKARPSGC